MAIEEFPPPLWVCPYGCGKQINKNGKPPLRGDACPQCGGLLEDWALEYNSKRRHHHQYHAFLQAAYECDTQAVRAEVEGYHSDAALFMKEQADRFRAKANDYTESPEPPQADGGLGYAEVDDSGA